MLYRFVSDEDKKVESIASDIAYALGFYSSPDAFIPVFANDFQQREETDSENVPLKMVRRNAILILIEELKGTEREELLKHVNVLIDVINTEIPNLDSSLIPPLLLVCYNLVETMSEDCKHFRNQFFRLILNIGGIGD